VLVEVASTDAYAARDILGHLGMHSRMSDHQQQNLGAVVTAAGLGVGHLPLSYEHALAAAVEHAESHLRGCSPQNALSHGPGTRHGPPSQP
jgi:hypothetical protein